MARMLGLVVDAVQHAVFESDEVPRGMRLVTSAGLQQLGYRLLAVQRHQVVAQSVLRSVQGHRQCDRAVLPEPIHHGHHA